MTASTRAGQKRGAVRETWTIGRVLTWAAKDFAGRAIESPRFEAELLLASALGLRRLDLYLRIEQPLSEGELAKFKSLVERRRKHEPVAYILGTRAFYNRDFKVDGRVLVPRPETESAVEETLAVIEKDAEGVAVLDVCTGSGCIAVSVACERPKVSVTAVDVSGDALAVARENASALGASERVTFVEGDLYAPVPAEKQFAVVVSNPPYIPHGELAGLMEDVRDHEPHLALDGGDDGLVLVRKVIAGAPGRLRAGGRLVVELHWDQGARAVELAKAAGFVEARVVKDFGGHERILVATLG